MSRAIVCPGCGTSLPARGLEPHPSYLASGECWEKKGELTAYNMTSGDTAFIQQLCVDAYGAQHTGPATKPITTVFSLIGLFHAVEHGFTGKQVQFAHMNLSVPPGGWPSLQPPSPIYGMTVQDVLNREPGKPRDEGIKAWENRLERVEASP